MPKATTEPSNTDDVCGDTSRSPAPRETELSTHQSGQKTQAQEPENELRTELGEPRDTLATVPPEEADDDNSELEVFVSSGHLICDADFCGNLKRMKELRSFFLREAVPLGDENRDLLSFGDLNFLRYSTLGRLPSSHEWHFVERTTQVLYSQLTAPLRRKFTAGDIPLWIPLSPIFLVVVAVASLIFAVNVLESFEGSAAIPLLGCYLAWLMSLGAIGAIAFLGMNILSVQNDVTFDLSNVRLMLLRIVLGALFALVLTIPFGLTGFFIFVRALAGRSQGVNDEGLTRQVVPLVLPFVLGFSTSLVIMILQRFVGSVQAFFGATKEDAVGLASSVHEQKPKA
jgi:hypothetical protein